MLSIRRLSLTGVLLLLLIAGCNKDIAPIESGSDVNTLVRLNWNQTEKQFFNFFNHSKVAKNDLKLTFRSGLTNVPPLLAEAYNQIARENDLHPFVDDLTRKIGIPFWLNAYVNMENLEGDGMVIIPFGFEEGKRVEALLVGIKSPELPHNYFHFEFVLRRDIDQMVRQNTIPDNRPNLFLELAHFIYDDAKIYQMMDGNLKNYIDQNIDLIDQIDGENIAGLRSCRYIRMLHCLSDGSTTTLDEWYNDNNSNGGTNEGFDSWSPWGQDLGLGPGNVINIYSDTSDGESLWDWIKKFLNSIFNNQNEGSETLYAREEIIKKNKTNELKISKSDPKSSGNIAGLRNNTDCIIYYHKYCEDGNGAWYQVSLDEIDECHQAMDNFLYQYNLNLDSEMIDFLMSQMNQGICYDQEEFNEFAAKIFLLNTANVYNIDQNPYKNLTECEKELINDYPIQGLKIFENKLIAEQITVSKFGFNGRNDCSDAFRHALFNALNTQQCGKVIAKLFADAHECETPPDKINEKMMDTFNNNIGILVSADNPNVHPNHLALLICETLENGNLRILSDPGDLSSNIIRSYGCKCN